MKILVQDNKLRENKAQDRIPRFGRKDYTSDSIIKRRQWLEEKTNVKLNAVGVMAYDSRIMQGNIEHVIGVSHVPLGVAGPIKVNGEYAKGDFYVPLATTEGALVKTYHRGMRVVSEAGGVNVRILKDIVHIDPAFFVDNIIDGQLFITWLEDNFLKIKLQAETTTSHGKLLEIIPFLTGDRIFLKFVYNTQDAQGLNMINKATDFACQFIRQATNKNYVLRSDLSAIKKVSTMNIHNGQGKSVIADVTISRKTLRLLQVTPESICKYQESWKTAVILSGTVSGGNAHVANLLAAIFIACGQDVADIAMSHVSTLNLSINREKDLYVSLFLPNLMLATVGGGTKLGTQKECLELLGCYGQDKVKKFAEIITATALAGDLACCAALDQGGYVNAHEKYGRNKPEEEK